MCVCVCLCYHSSFFVYLGFWQDGLKKIAAEEEAADSDSNSSSGSGTSSDSSSSFGCDGDSEESEKGKKRKGGGQPKKAAKKARAEKPPRETTRPAKGGKDHSVRESKAAKEAAAAMKGSKESGEKLLNLLIEITAPALWRSAVRHAEVDRRLGRVDQVSNEIKDAFTHLEADDQDKQSAIDMTQSLQQQYDRVSALRDLCKFVRTASSEMMVEDISSAGSIAHHFGQCFSSLIDAEGTLVEMIQAICKKLLDVPWHC